MEHFTLILYYYGRNNIIHLKVGDDMKKVNKLQLIASLCLLASSIINLLDLYIEIPSVVAVCSIPLLFVSAVLLCVLLIRIIKIKKINKQIDDN